MAAKTIDAADVREAVRGIWLSVLEDLAVELGKALERPGRHAACPVHGGRDGFRLFRDVEHSGGGICNTCGCFPDGFSLLMWLKSWDFPNALRAVSNVLGLTGAASKLVLASRRSVTCAQSNRGDARTRQVLRDIWKTAQPADHPDAEILRRYLANRGLDAWVSGLPDLRFHAGLQYWNDDGHLVGTFPAMLGLVSSSEGEPVTIHRTFLTSDGRKAPVDSPRKLMPVPRGKRLGGSAIRLGRPGRVLCIAEGIETALAVSEATGMVTWATISATLMERFVPPPGVERLLIWADNDPVKKGRRAGPDAAQGLRQRLAERDMQIDILLPNLSRRANGESVDWLDVLNERGGFGFPSLGQARDRSRGGDS